MKTFIYSLIAASTLASSVAFSQVPSFSSGAIRSVSVQPDGGTVVTLTDITGPCGSEFFFLPGTQANVKSLYALFLTAYSLGQAVNVQTVSCDAATNVIDAAFVLQ